MSNTYKIDYTTNSVHHHRFYNALNEDTALSMFLTEADTHHTDIDTGSLVVECCNIPREGDSCECECHED